MTNQTPPHAPSPPPRTYLSRTDVKHTQGMMGRYGMQVPAGGPAAAVAAQHAAAYHAAAAQQQQQQQAPPGSYGMMHLNNAMGMMNIGGGVGVGAAGGAPPPGARPDGAGAGGGVVDGSAGSAVTFGMAGGGNRSMMRGDQPPPQQQQHAAPPAGIPAQMLSPSAGYGAGGPGVCGCLLVLVSEVFVDSSDPGEGPVWLERFAVGGPMVVSSFLCHVVFVVFGGIMHRSVVVFFGLGWKLV